MFTPSSLFHGFVRLVLGSDYPGWKRDVWDPWWAQEESEAAELEKQDEVTATVILDLIGADRSYAPAVRDAMQWWPLAFGGIVAFCFTLLLVHDRTQEQIRQFKETDQEFLDRVRLDCPGCTVEFSEQTPLPFVEGYVTIDGKYIPNHGVLGVPMDWDLDLPLNEGDPIVLPDGTLLPTIPDANGTVPMPSEWGPDFPADPLEPDAP